jgi:four helix bundle protein
MSSREFKRFLLIARGSNSELQTQLEVAANLKLANSRQLDDALGLSGEVENMLFALLGRMRNNSS